MAATPQDLIRSELLAMPAYPVSEATGMVKLDAMENPYPLSEAARRGLAEALAGAPINRYPEPTGRHLRELLARRMMVPAGMELLLGNGSDDLIQIVSFALARPGAAMLFPEPTFVVYRMNAGLSGMRPVGVPLHDDLRLDRGRMLAAIREHRPALVFLAYPNNPTGVLADEADVEAVLREAGGVVVVDEAYQPFAKKSFMSRLPEFPNLVVMRTVSKIGLAGLRLGYLAARPEWVREFNKARQVYNVGVLPQTAALYLLEHHAGEFDDQAARILAERAPLGEALAQLPGVRVFPSAANFFLVRVPDAPRVYAGLRERRVLVRSFHGSHPLLENCLRITVGTPQENRQLLAALADSLREVACAAPK